MARPERRRRSADVPVAILALAVFVGLVAVLARSTAPMVTALSSLSRNDPGLDAAYLAVLCGLPGLLWTLPRALARARPDPTLRVNRRHQVTIRRRGHLRTAAAGVVLLLVAQVPLPAPWARPERRRRSPTSRARPRSSR